MNLIVDSIKESTYVPSTIYDHFKTSDTTWQKDLAKYVADLWEVILAKVDEWRQLYDIDLYQVNQWLEEKWQQITNHFAQ